MNLKVVAQTENALLGRKEVIVKIDNQGPTPPESELIDKLSASLNIDKDLVVVKTISQKFGTQESEAVVKIYDSKEILDKIEPKKKEAGKKKEERPEGAPDDSGMIKIEYTEEEKAAIAAKKAAAEGGEAPAEEKKEEPKKEEKPEEKKEEAKSE